MSELVNNVDEINKAKYQEFLQRKYDEFIRDGVDNEKIMKSYHEEYGSDKEIIAAFEKRHNMVFGDEFSRWDYAIRMKEAYKVGWLSVPIERFVEAFPKEKILEVAKVLLKDNMDINNIVKLTKLTVDEIIALKKNR